MFYFNIIFRHLTRSPHSNGYSSITVRMVSLRYRYIGEPSHRTLRHRVQVVRDQSDRRCLTVRKLFYLPSETVSPLKEYVIGKIYANGVLTCRHYKQFLERKTNLELMSLAIFDIIGRLSY